MMEQRDKYIEELVERFLDGTTTRKEEQELYGYFSGDDIPEHLAPYKKMFHWFENGLAEEVSEEGIPEIPLLQPRKRFRIWGTVATVAAAVALLIIIRPKLSGPEFDPYEGSYIVRNGIVITDPELVRPEIGKVLQMADKQEKEIAQLLLQTHEAELSDLHRQYSRGKEILEIIDNFPEGEAREEVIKILLDNE